MMRNIPSKTRISLFLHKCFPLIPVCIACMIFSFANVLLLHLPLPIPGYIQFWLVLFATSICLLSENHKLYKFKARQAECEKLFDHINKQSKGFHASEKNYYCKEIFDKHHNFQYTEVIVPRYSAIASLINDLSMNKFKKFPENFSSIKVKSEPVSFTKELGKFYKKLVK
jgi:hypothetical protein